MNIFLTVHQYFPEYSSGTEVLTFETAQELRKFGHQVTIISGFPSKVSVKDTDRFEKFIYKGIEGIRFHHYYEKMGEQSNLMELEYNNRLVYSYFVKLLKDKKPDIVHIFHLSRLSASIFDACTDVGVPVVMTPTDFWLICPTNQLRLPDNSLCSGPYSDSRNCLRHIVEKNQSTRMNELLKKIPDWLLSIIIFFIRIGINFDGKYSLQVRALINRKPFLTKRMNKINKLFIPTKIMLSLLNRNGLKAENYKILPFGINFDHLDIDNNPKANNKLVLGFIGTIYEHKGVHVLVDAVHRLADKNIELRIYGNMDDFPKYVERLNSIFQNDGRIKFCGTFPNAEIGSIISSLDALVVPSIWYENTPLVIHSAQAVGCPVIASNMPGISVLIENGVNGLLFEPGDVSELVRIINRILNNKNILQDLKRKAIKPSSIKEYVSSLLESYEEIVSKKVTI